MLKIVLQLTKEFWLPMLISIAWTVFNFKQVDLNNLALKDVINVFGPTFFLASWLLSQFFRVKNQQHVRSGLMKIEQGISDLGAQANQRLEKDRQLILEAQARRIKEGAPKFQVVQNDRLPDRFFYGLDEIQTPYFAWMTNCGKSVNDVGISIEGATLQMVQGDQRSDYNFHVPVWATGMCLRVVWTYIDSHPADCCTMSIDFTDAFGEKSSSVFSIAPGVNRDQDDFVKLEISENLRSGESVIHAGEPNFGYDYGKHDARRLFKSELKIVEAKVAEEFEAAQKREGSGCIDQAT
jgi:hypothetical protein